MYEESLTSHIMSNLSMIISKCETVSTIFAVLPYILAVWTPKSKKSINVNDLILI